MPNRYELSLVLWATTWNVFKTFAQIAKPLMTIMHHDAKLDGTLTCQAAFITLKGALIQTPILHYPDPMQWYLVYAYTSYDACRAPLSQEHNGKELPVAFLLHTFTDTQYKWSTPKQEAYGVHYTITKWNYYLQRSNIVHNVHKSFQKFLNGKNTNIKVNWWSLELATYNITFKWISGAHNKAAYCLSRQIEVVRNNAAVTSILINSVRASPADGPATHTGKVWSSSITGKYLV